MDREDWDRKYSAQGYVWTTEPNVFVAAELASLPPGRALDLAAGEGRNAVWLAQRGWEVTAVDFSRVALDKGRALAAERAVEVAWVLADLRQYSPAVAAFDLVLVLYLQLPAAERRAVLGRAAAALRSGGTMLVIGHDSTNPEQGYGGPQDPAVLYGPEDVVDDLPGLTVERAERVRRPVNTVDGVREAIDALVRAVAPRVPG